jgi:gamma-glutamylcyclotransferase (GGCT)/AIG2-like uncharacterized protein YtfP
MTALARPAASRTPYPDLIPTSAAGRDPLFFFGTLMHHEVLETVLDRRVADHETTEPAILHGYRRERAAAASYPVLVRDKGARVEGRLLHRPSERCILRINHFEDEEYRASRVTVTVGRNRLAAWVFLPLDHVAMMRPSGEPWHLDHWAAQHLDAYREAIAGWMVDAPG